MPLPLSSAETVWPPEQLTPIFAKMSQWDAWFTGDLAKLQEAYGGGSSADSTGFFASQTGGFKAAVGRTLQRWFVGQPPQGTERNTKLPIPIAAEICQASSDLLFSDPVSIKMDLGDSKPKTPADSTKPVVKVVNSTQVRIDELADDSLHSTLAEAAELCAALGGVYLRVTWDDKTVADAPFVTIVDADQAIPEFQFGRLTAVTFWKVVLVVGDVVYRHLERHELRDGVGVIVHGLYMGKNDRLGLKVSLSTVPATAGLDALPNIDMEGMISTESDGLAVIYVPNQTPNRSWRQHPVGRYLGRSDLDGIEHLMDQLAEVMSAWTRAIRLGKARIMMDAALLKSGGPGKGAIANLEQESYVALPGGLSTVTASLEERIQLMQPKIEYEQYAKTAEALTEQILQMAGYSMQTFGVNVEGGGVKTATEVESRERRSLMTRARKIREWRPAIEQLMLKLLAVDNAIFSQNNDLSGVLVEFNDGVQETAVALSATVLALYQSESASTRERVAIMHADWEEDQIDAEVALIQAEFAAPEPLDDPANDPFGAPDGGGPHTD